MVSSSASLPNCSIGFHEKALDDHFAGNVGDFRLIDRVVVDVLNSTPEHHRFMKGLFAWVGFRTVTLDYTRGVRRVRPSSRAGSSGISPSRVSRALARRRSSSGPYVGILGALTTLVYALRCLAHADLRC